MSFLTITESIGDGVISVPETLWDGIKRTGQGLAFWNTDEEIKIAGQNDRAYEALKGMIKYGVSNYNSPIVKAIQIILYNYYESLPDSEKKKIISTTIDKGFFVAGKMVTSITLSQFVADKIAKKIIANSVMKKLFRFTISSEFTLLAMQGLLYKAGAASDRLKKQYPRIYMQLYIKNLDMVYFLIEESMQKYLNAIRLNGMQLNTNL